MRPKRTLLGALCLLLASGLLAGFAQRGASAASNPAPNDPGFAPYRVYLDLTHAPDAWPMGTCSGVTVAVLDSGVNPIPDLAGALLPGYNFVDNNPDTSDVNGHGTQIASVIAGAVDNGVGIAGICSKVKILPVRVTDSLTRWAGNWVIQGIHYAVSQGAKVINLSLGTGNPAVTQPMADAVNYALESGVVVVIAAGNDGSSDPSNNVLASGSPLAIRVAGVDLNNQIDPLSNRGSWLDIAASFWLATDDRDGSVRVDGGTSTATPQVSATAAMLLGNWPQLNPAQVKQDILDGCTHVPGLPVGQGSYQGCLLNVPGAMVAAGYKPPTASTQTTTTQTAPQRITVLVRPTGKGSVRIGATACSQSCRTIVSSVSRLVAVATAHKGWRFAGWSGLCHGSKSPCSFTARSGTLGARFVKK